MSDLSFTGLGTVFIVRTATVLIRPYLGGIRGGLFKTAFSVI